MHSALHNNTIRPDLFPLPFIDEETEAPRSLRQEVAEPGFRQGIYPLPQGQNEF